MRRSLLAVLALFLLAACSAEQVWAPDHVIQRSIYRHDGPPRLTLYTMISNNNGRGGHTSLMVNGTQRLIFDPAGSFKHESIPERNDVLFGITPAVARGYTLYHARETWRVKVQEIDVSPDVARRAERLIQTYGAVPPAQCALSTSRILAELFPGRIETTWYPNQLSANFSNLPNVREQVLHDYDSDDNSHVLENWDPALYAEKAAADAAEDG